jgi:hypothetical protein
MAQIQHLDIGDIWKPQATFTVGGTPTDPTTLIIRIKKPSGTVTVTTESSPAALTSASSPTARTTTGIYVFSQTIDASGYWYARMEGTGAATAAEDHEVIVDPSPFYENGGLSTRALVSLGEAKMRLSRQLIDTASDLKIVEAINGASERIHAVSGREFKPRGANPEERSFDITWNGGSVEISDLQTMSSASTSATITNLQTGSLVRTLASTDYVAIPRNRHSSRPIERFRILNTAIGAACVGNVLNVTGYWGWPAVPEDIKNACLDAVAFWLDSDVEHFRQDLGGVPGGSEGGQTIFVGSTPPTVFPLPPIAFQIASGYRRRLIG